MTEANGVGMERADQPRQPPPRTLLEQIIRRSRRTIEENCAAFEKTARANGEDASLSPRQFQRWIAGEVGMSRPVCQRVAELHWGYDFEALIGPPIDDGGVGAQPDQPRSPNELLRRARLRHRSPSGSGRPLSRQELAEAVNAHVFAASQRIVTLDGNYLGKLERGEIRWPTADYRQGLRAILDAASDAELGFYIIRRMADDDDDRAAVEVAELPTRVVRQETQAMQLVVTPGTAVIVVPADHPVLLALVTGK